MFISIQRSCDQASTYFTKRAPYFTISRNHHTVPGSLCFQGFGQIPDNSKLGRNLVPAVHFGRRFDESPRVFTRKDRKVSNWGEMRCKFSTWRSLNLEVIWQLLTTALWPRKVYAHLPGKATILTRWEATNYSSSCRVEQPLENQIQKSRRLAHSDLCLRHWRKVPSPDFATVEYSSLSVYPFWDVFGPFKCFVFHFTNHVRTNAKLGSEPKLMQYQKDSNKDIQRWSYWFLSEEAIKSNFGKFVLFQKTIITCWMAHDDTRQPWYPRMREPRWKLVAGACGSLPHCAPEQSHSVDLKNSSMCLDIAFISFINYTSLCIHVCSISLCTCI